MTLIDGHLVLALPERVETAHTYGASVAGDDFVRAVLRCSQFSAISLAHLEEAAPQYQTMLASIARRMPGGTISGLPLREFVHGHSATKPDVWHDIRPRGNHYQTLLVRDRSARVYPVGFTHHTLSYPEYQHALFLSLLLAPTRACDALVCTSHAAKSVIEKQLATVSERLLVQTGMATSWRAMLPVIPLGVDTDRFCPRDQRDARRQVGLPEDVLMLLWLGRIAPSDKADLTPLLRAVARLTRAQPDLPVVLVLASSNASTHGSQLMTFARHLGIAERLRIVDAVLPQYAQLWYAAADVFVSPIDNVQETIGITPLEAMACGVPQLVADWDGYRDTVQEGVTGFRIPTLALAGDAAVDTDATMFQSHSRMHAATSQSVAVDLDLLETKLAELLSSESLRARMGQASRRRAVECFSWPVIIAGYEALWTEQRAIASRELPASVLSDTYLDVQYGEIFASYRTHTLSPDALVALTDEGRLFAQGRERLPSPGPWPFFDPRLAQALCSVIEQAEASEMQCTLRSCDALAGPAAVADPQRVARHVLWLAKHGFIRVLNGRDARH